jgi:cobalamin 5'-phosphate synthase/cobalamin synthase
VIPVGLRAALRHLTVLPLPYDVREADLAPARTLPWFPVVGLAIGGAVWCVLQLPLPSLPRAAIALAVWTAASGGLHEDGLMDCADAAFAPVSAERRSAILRDPHVGAHAVTSVTLLLILRFAALAAGPAAAALAAPVIGRFCMTLTVARWRPARRDGLGAAFARGARPFGSAAITVLLLAGIAAIERTPWTLVAAVAGIFAGVAAAASLASRLGGVTGDVHGAAGLVAETAALYSRLVWT